MYLEQSTIVRAIFKARVDRVSHAVREPKLRAFLDQMRAIGWGVLAEIPGREIVMGAVTRPWMADVVFRPLPPDQFAAFAEPDYVKIAWTLRADPIGAGASIFRTETRVVTTDRAARAKFRRYWAFASPGIILIRWASLGPLKAEAERRVGRCAEHPRLRRFDDPSVHAPEESDPAGQECEPMTRSARSPWRRHTPSPCNPDAIRAHIRRRRRTDYRPQP